MNRRVLAIAGGVLLAAGVSSASRADERPLIWQPIKNSDTSYAVKLGLRLPVRLETEAGFNFGVDSSKAGEVVNTPLKFWSRIKTADTKRPAYQMSRDIGINMDGIAGSAAITMNYYEKQIATPTFNLERQATYAVRYDGAQKDWTGLDASQSIKLRQRETRTAFVAVANGTANFSTIGASFGIEQPVGQNITLSGQVNRNFTDATTVSSVNARYSYSW
jgi:hypothetical protein